MGGLTTHSTGARIARLLSLDLPYNHVSPRPVNSGVRPLIAYLNMYRIGFYIISTLSVAISAALVSCLNTPTPQSSTPSPSPPSITDKKEAGTRTITFENPRLKLFLSEWWPTEVINVTEVETGRRKGDWIIEIRNVSDGPIKSVVMVLNSPDHCEAFVMSPGWIVGLGADDPYLTRPARPTLGPGETDKIVVGREYLEKDIIPTKEMKRCPPDESYCFLRLEQVNYADGTKWIRKHDPDDPNWPDR